MSSEIEAILEYVVARENYRHAMGDKDSNYTTIRARIEEVQAKYEGLKDVLREHKRNCTGH